MINKIKRILIIINSTLTISIIVLATFFYFLFKYEKYTATGVACNKISSDISCVRNNFQFVTPEKDDVGQQLGTRVYINNELYFQYIEPDVYVYIPGFVNKEGEPMSYSLSIRDSSKDDDEMVDSLAYDMISDGNVIKGIVIDEKIDGTVKLYNYPSKEK